MVRKSAGRSAAERLHGDDSTVPILAKGMTVTGHIWTYMQIRFA
jgi:hypothetical protein